MKERLDRVKKFLKEHEETVAFTGLALLGAVVGAIAMTKDLEKRHRMDLNRAYNGGRVDTIEHLHRVDGVEVTLAHTRDGRTFRFDKDQ